MLKHSSEKEAFITHLNYAKCLNSLVLGCSIGNSGSLELLEVPLVDGKKSLISLTKKSLADEYQIVQIDRDYSYASTSWLPIKGYYLLFNQMLTILYLLTGKENAFSLRHTDCMDKFTRMLEQRSLGFNNDLLNQVFNKNIFNFHEAPGANLSLRTSVEKLFQMAMKKVALYKLEDWKRMKNLRTESGRKQKARYLQDFKISVFEFPYYMRIRSNYKDFVFIEKVSTWDTKEYFETYYSFIVNFNIALENLKKMLFNQRVGGISDI